MQDASSVPAPQYFLYIDDSGSRFLDRLAVDADRDPQWFTLGGVLVREEDKPACETAHAEFLLRWPEIIQPLHLTDMHSRRKGFAWLDSVASQKRGEFWADYHALIAGLPIIAVGCVVHRPGYRDRGYGSREGDAKWNLCRTAFNILIERSAKIAHAEGRRLRVRYEGSDKKSDGALKEYWRALKSAQGLGFNAQNAAKYDPFPPDALAATLIDLERKDKRSVLVQFADTCALAISKGRYQPDFSTYVALQSGGRLADIYVGEERAGSEGIKYSCFDGP
ncbi:DUF3800 domain-containing protein [Brevundimonas pishanensis]|uniref:DUF3800 domain-containing protein n=1 Tax=Brevundimonas pishanensis TaxID=2896315 RepID=UPI001FA7F0A1|nr:DUF3800 domain-containing protein [Brevundimonas pishanensis]